MVEVQTLESKAHEVTRLLAQMVFALVALFGGVFLIGRLFRQQLTDLGTAFVERLGLLGVGLGVFFSDAFAVPIPPQAYVLAALAGRASPVTTFAVACGASIVAGLVAYELGHLFKRISFFERVFARTHARVDALMRRWGRLGAVVLAVSPIPFSTLCYLSGMYRMPKPLFRTVLALRVPRLIVTCLIVQWSLHASGAA